MPNQPRFHIVAICLALAVICLPAGPAGSGERLEPIPGQRDRIRDPELAAANARLDPAADGWDSEVFAEAAHRQLATIGDLLEAERPIDAASLGGLAAADFSTTGLRPPGLLEVFRDESFTVLRARSGGVEGAPAAFKSADGLSRALKELLGPMSGAPGIRVELEIIGVEVKPGTAAATVLFHASGRAPAGAVEQTATWRTRWARSSPAAPPRLTSIEVEDYEEVMSPGRAAPLFGDVTESVLGHNRGFREDLVYGVDHWLERLESWIETDSFGHHGIAVGDVNGDGLDDLYVCEMAGLPNRLFVQNPDGTATETSAEAGVDWLERTRSALFIDLDNDGDEDLVVASSVALLFMANDGKGRFSVKASLSAGDGMVTAGAPPAATRTGGIPEQGMEGGHYQRSGDFGAVKTSDIVSLAAADYDNDGLIDIYACAYHNSGEEASRFPLPMPYHDANNGGSNLMIRNEGAWRFSNVTRASGLDVNNSRFSFAASWEDYDNDGDQDLYVANDFGRSNLYRNDRGRFVDVAPQAGVQNMAAGMSVSWADYDNDGWMDIYVGNMFSAAGSRISTQSGFKQGSDAATLAAYRHHAMGNSLFRNMGNGKFREVGAAAAVAMGRWAWSSNFIDINNDGWEDLLVANGYFTKENPEDLSSFFWRRVVAQSPDTAVEPVSAPEYSRGWRELGRMIRRGRSFSGRERNCAFLNTRGPRFASASAATGLDFIDDARAVAVTDWDSDGDLDIWIANRTGPRLRLARNEAPAGRRHLSLLLEGRTSNRDAIGARIELHLGGQPARRIIKTLHAGDGYLAQSTRWVHFGLGDATSIDKLVVRWPGGTAEEIAGVAAGGRYRIVQGAGKAERPAGPERRVSLAASELDPIPPTDRARILLAAPVPYPSLEYHGLEGDAVTPEGTGPVLIYLWSAANAASVDQLGVIGRRADELKSKGLRVVALSTDGVAGADAPDPAPVRAILEAIRFPFEAGFAYPDLIDKLDLLQHTVIWSPRPLPVPTSLLVDGDGLLAAVYKGPLSIDQLFSDLPALRATGEKRLSLAIPFAGMRQMRGTPDFFNYMDDIAQAYSDGGYHDEAAAHYRKVLRIQPARAQAHFGLAAALASMNQMDEAIAEYRKTIEIAPEHVAALNDLGFTLAGRGQIDEAISLYRRALSVDPRNVPALSNLGTALSGQGRIDEAVGLYRQALAVEPDNTLALNNLAVALGRQGKDDEAIAHYARVLKVDPGNVPVLVNLASALIRQGRFPDAVLHLTEAVRLRPDHAETHHTLGIALLKQGQTGESIRRLQEALRLRPGDVQTQYYLSIALAREGRAREAVDRFAELLKIEPGSPAAAQKLAWILATSQDSTLRDGARAVELAMMATEATGNQQYSTLDALAAAYAETGRFREAIDTARKAIEAVDSRGEDAVVQKLRARLALYEAGKPYRE